MKASQLIQLLQEKIDEYGDGDMEGIAEDSFIVVTQQFESRLIQGQLQPGKDERTFLRFRIEQPASNYGSFVFFGKPD